MKNYGLQFASKRFYEMVTHMHTKYLQAHYSELTNIGSEVTNLFTNITLRGTEYSLSVANLDSEVTNPFSDVTILSTNVTNFFSTKVTNFALFETNLSTHES